MKNTINELIKNATNKHPDDVDVLEYAEMIYHCLDIDKQPYLALRKCISFINGQNFDISGYFLSNIIDNTENGIDTIPNSWLFTFMNDCVNESESGFFQIEVICDDNEFKVHTWPIIQPLKAAVQGL